MAAEFSSASAGETRSQAQIHKDWMTKYARSQDSKNTLELEHDLFTNAYVTMVDSYHTFWSSMIPAGLMVAIAAVQLTAVFYVFTYVEDAMVAPSSYHMATAMELYLGTNKTLPIGIIKDICGSYEQIEISAGPRSRLTTSDGTIYQSSAGAPLHYSIKLPEHTWDLAKMTDDRSILLDAAYVVQEGFYPLTWNHWGTGYALLFYVVTVILMYTVLVEIRSAMVFGWMVLVVPVCRQDEACLVYDEKTKHFSLKRQTQGAKVMGLAISIFRATLALMLLGAGTWLMSWTTTKLDLILDSLALAFLFELDNIVYRGSVSGIKQKLIQDLELVSFPPPFGGALNHIRTYIPMVLLLFAIAYTIIARYIQLGMWRQVFDQAATVCLFTGPTPGGRQDVVAPAIGLCESLLGTRCAPTVSGPGSAYGPCVVSDMTAYAPATFSHYLVTDLYEHMVDNSTSSMLPSAGWGRPRADTLSSGLWYPGTMLEDLRRACVRMYDRTGSLDTRIVDIDTGEVMDGAPFFCPRDVIFPAAFGRALANLDANSPTPLPASFLSPMVVEALDKCHESQLVTFAHQTQWEASKATRSLMEVSSLSLPIVPAMDRKEPGETSSLAESMGMGAKAFLHSGRRSASLKFGGTSGKKLKPN